MEPADARSSRDRRAGVRNLERRIGSYMTTLLVVRHGQTDWNRAGRFQGWADLPLNEKGRAQAAAAAEMLAREQPCALYSSDLRRALESADIVGDEARAAGRAAAGLTRGGCWRVGRAHSQASGRALPRRRRSLAPRRARVGHRRERRAILPTGHRDRAASTSTPPAPDDRSCIPPASDRLPRRGRQRATLLDRGAVDFPERSAGAATWRLTTNRAPGRIYRTMKIVITGGAGFLGQRVAQRLLQLGALVISLQRRFVPNSVHRAG